MGPSCLDAFSATALLGSISFNLSFSLGISKTHLNLESINSSGFASFHTASISEVFGGAKIVCTMNLCLLFSLGS
uniref:Uncharacterized protein n=1 Tax=Marmota marmota marmota TaxID=9994 RepID=A0A8C6ETY2_MARMA